MKRLGYLYDKICSLENLQAADSIARKGKSKQYGIRLHDRNRDQNIIILQEKLLNRTYRTSPYTTFKIFEPKERLVFRLPYYPDRIVHHAIMNVLEPVFISVFTRDTYSCIKGRGIHDAARRLQYVLNDEPATRYCLKLDVKKFYPSIDHDILKKLLRRKIKDPNLLWLLDEIIDSAPGVPIGNYLSQYFANYYLTRFDHWIKEVLRIKFYFRYADDIVIVGPTKEYLHQIFQKIREYLRDELRLQIKGNYQVFPVQARGIDVLGYRFFHGYTLLRKSIKKNFARMLVRRPNRQSIASYYGWACHANTDHLLKTLLNEKFFRIQNRRLSKGIHGRQNKNRTAVQPANNSP